MNLMDAYVFAKLLAGQGANGELTLVSPAFRIAADHLAGLPPPDRQVAWAAILACQPDPNAIVLAVANADPNGPPPDQPCPAATATLADVRRQVATTDWMWPGWLASGALNGLAADPGCGKTILAADLARRLWFGLEWPDGQGSTTPPGTKTLWVPGDRHFSQMLGLAAGFGLPDEAVLFNSGPDEPTAGLDLDDEAERAALKARIQSDRPGLVVIDTVGMTTGMNLCRPEDARLYFGPLMDMAAETGVPFLMLTHLSKDAQALGRRIVGACRAVWKLTCPDPDGQPDRRKLWVDKSYLVKPVPLGMTIAPAGCSFDFNPPTEPEPEARKPGPAPAKLEACKAWLTDRLGTPDRVRDIRADADREGFSANTLYRARDVLGIEEYEMGGKWWKLPIPAAP